MCNLISPLSIDHFVWEGMGSEEKEEEVIKWAGRGIDSVINWENTMNHLFKCSFFSTRFSTNPCIVTCYQEYDNLCFRKYVGNYITCSKNFLLLKEELVYCRSPHWKSFLHSCFSVRIVVVHSNFTNWILF